MRKTISRGEPAQCPPPTSMPAGSRVSGAGRGRAQVEGGLAHEIVGVSPAVRRLRQLIAAVAPAETSVLITGETGTGKGVVARALHAASPRRRAPFVHVDCAALPPALIESELFGHERGAFTGAHAGRRGRFEQAGAGTLFLDEIGELPPALQVKLLRALQDRVFERVGGGASLRLSARVLAATNRDLRRDLAEGHFREDLYYRLLGVWIRVPPLRERLEDLPHLAAHWRALRSRQGGGAIPSPDSALLQRFLGHSWPGNVREFFNGLERWLIAVRCGGGAGSSGLRELLFDGVGSPWEDPGLLHVGEGHGAAASAAVAPPVPKPPIDTGAAGERSRISAALLATGGNVARAARRLELSRTTLRRRIHRYQLHSLIPRD